MCSPSLRLGLGSPQPSPVGWWCTRVGFSTPVPAERPRQQLGIAPTPNPLLSHKHSSCPLPSMSHILPYILTTSLSHSLSSYMKKKVYFLSLGVHPASTLAEMEEWGCGVWQIAFVMLGYPYLTKKSQVISFATMIRPFKH